MVSKATGPSCAKLVEEEVGELPVRFDKQNLEMELVTSTHMTMHTSPTCYTWVQGKQGNVI